MEEVKNELYDALKPVLENYQEGFTSKKRLLQVKDFYFKKKYMQPILDKIG